MINVIHKNLRNSNGTKQDQQPKTKEHNVVHNPLNPVNPRDKLIFLYWQAITKEANYGG